MSEEKLVINSDLHNKDNDGDNDGDKDKSKVDLNSNDINSNSDSDSSDGSPSNVQRISTPLFSEDDIKNNLKKINEVMDDLIENTYQWSYLDYVYVKSDTDKLNEFGEEIYTNYYNRLNKYGGENYRDELKLECTGTDTCDFEEPEECNKEIHYAIRYNFNDLKYGGDIFPNTYTVVMYNSTGYHFSHRGSDHTKIKLDYHQQYVLQNSCYWAISDALYRIKSHKFEYSSEVYDRCVVSVYGNEIHINVYYTHKLI